MKIRNALAAAMALALLGGAAPPAQDFNGAKFEINRDRVTYGTLKTCAKGTTYLVPTTYLYVTARTRLSAGGGLGKAKAKARVFIEGLSRSELQELSGQITDAIVARLRASGYTVLTWDDVKGDVADKERWPDNPRYGVPTHDARLFPGTDFAVAAPSDEQALSYGLMGPAANFGKAAQRTGATLLLPEIYLTLPQLGGSTSQTYSGTHASISFDPAMHLAGAYVYGATAKGGWCSINVPEHGVRTPAPFAGEFTELGVKEETFGDEWSTKSGDYTFAVNDAAFRTGVLATGRSLASLIGDAMDGKTK
ncbi:MAG: hypothetical protein J7496_09075 [Novosphingobium sp.]|nr:hypothetical protein [Novosphingobium sp.]